jgi:hypothetical protein
MTAAAQVPVNIGSRLELFADDTLIERVSGGALRQLHHPTPQDPVLVMDKLWEGNGVNYITVFKDGTRYRMYYRGAHSVYTAKSDKEAHPDVTCYAESQDGIHWTKPTLRIQEFQGSSENNVIWQGIGGHNFAPFRDTNPAAAPDARYKAVGSGKWNSHQALFAFKSPDGIHWSRLSEEPIITKGAFDSQNLAFWDTTRGEYREYHRDFRDGRDIRTSTSSDFIHWTDPVFLEYSPSRVSELYTNQIIPYYRAPHIFLGFPTRYIDRGWTPAAEYLPRVDYRRLRGAKSPREGSAVTDGMFMATHDPLHFTLWPESFLRPGLRATDTWFYGDVYQNWGLVETASGIADAPKEISIFVTESTLQERTAYIRRYTIRIDGFVSLTAPLSGGEVLTKPLIFKGDRLLLNYSTSAAGSIRVEIQNAIGQPIPGFTLAEAAELYGDSLAQPALWKGNPDLGRLSGTPVRLRIDIRDADLYSIRCTAKQ